MARLAAFELDGWPTAGVPTVEGQPGLLGRGAMGEVWSARAPDGTLVAIKVANQRVRDNPKLLKLIDGEVRAMARLDHPTVTWVYDHGHVPAGTPFPEGAPYMVLEHCGDGTLVDRGLADWTAVRNLAVALLDGLAHAHAHGIVHRDLKPANVLWAGTSDVRPGPKLGDFGIAYAIGVDGAGGPTAGTPSYMAPEQADRGRIGPWTDLYALGAVLWEVCTGSPPYASADLLSTLAATRRGLLPKFVPRFEVPPDLRAWLARLLARDPDHRFVRAAEALRALSSLDDAVRVPEGSWRTDRRAGPRLRLQGAGLGLLPLRELEVAGRTAERQLLWDTLGASASDGPRVVVLRGVSGIGKSRLANWLAERAAELAVAEPVVVDGRDPAPLAALLAGLFQLNAGPADRAAAVASAVVASRLPEAARERVRALLDDPWARWGTVPAVRQVIRSLAAGAAGSRRPRLLVLDDAHASESAIRLVRALLAERATHPAALAIVLVVEDEALARLPELQALVEGLDGVRGVDVVRLGPLAPAEQDELLDAIVGLAPETHAAVLAAAGGHPGHIVAQVQAWVREGVLAPTPRGFRPVRALPAAGTTLQAIWEERLGELAAALDPDALVQLERAAVLGVSVDEELWEAACDDPTAAIASSGRVRVAPNRVLARVTLVDRLIAAGLAHDTDQGFVFAHPALVEALIERARAAGRLERHHLACAIHLRARPQPQNALQLGIHLAEAGEWTQAVNALSDGIDYVWTHADRRPLIAELDRADACADRADIPANDARRARILQLRAIVLTGLGRMDEARDAAVRAWQVGEASGDRKLMCEAAMRLCDITAVAQDWTSAAVWFERFLAVEDACPRQWWGGIVRARLGKLALAAGDEAGAAEWFAASERILLGCPDPRSPPVLNALIELYAWRGDDARILEIAGDVERVSAEAGRLSEQAFAASKLVEAALATGDVALARASALRSLALGEQTGDRRSIVFMCGQLANVAVKAEDWREALGWAERGIERLGSMRHPWLQAMMWIIRGECLLRLGDPTGIDRSLAMLADVAPYVPPDDRQVREALEEWERTAVTAGDVDRAEQIRRVRAQVHVRWRPQTGPAGER